MKIEDVIKQLQMILPTVTNDFSDQVSVVSITPSGSTATVTTATPHGLVVGEMTNISGTLAPVEIATITRSGTVATATTVTNHDITENDITTEVTLSGATEAEFNGVFPFLSANNRKQFKFTVADAGPTSATGSPLLEDPPSAFGYNGFQTLVTVPTTTTFTYTLPVVLTEDAVGVGIVHTNIRITGAVNMNRAADMYTKQTPGQLYAFATLGDTSASKDRNARNDATAALAAGSSRRQQIFQDFSVHVLSTVTNETSARAARDKMEDVMAVLFKSLLGWKAPTGVAGREGLGVIFVSHGQGLYNTAVYVHEFQFQLLASITEDDTTEGALSVAFRDIALTMGTNLGTEKLIADIDLDDEPIP